MEFFLWISCYFSFVFFHSVPLSLLQFHPDPAFAILFALPSHSSFPFHQFSLPSFLYWALLPSLTWKVAIEKSGNVVKASWEYLNSFDFSWGKLAIFMWPSQYNRSTSAVVVVSNSNWQPSVYYRILCLSPLVIFTWPIWFKKGYGLMENISLTLYFS